MGGGRVQLPLLREPPPYLKYLLGKESGQLGINFRKNIRAYNSMFGLHPWVAELMDLSITQRGHTFSGCVVRIIIV